jgi:hypothetical protein
LIRPNAAPSPIKDDAPGSSTRIRHRIAKRRATQPDCPWRLRIHQSAASRVKRPVAKNAFSHHSTIRRANGTAGAPSTIAA